MATPVLAAFCQFFEQQPRDWLYIRLGDRSSVIINGSVVGRRSALINPNPRMTSRYKDGMFRIFIV